MIVWAAASESGRGATAVSSPKLPSAVHVTASGSNGIVVTRSDRARRVSPDGVRLLSTAPDTTVPIYLRLDRRTRALACPGGRRDDWPTARVGPGTLLNARLQELSLSDRQP